MKTNKELKREGIEVISKVDTLTVNTLVKNIADTLLEAFPEIDFNSKNLFMRLSKLNMYFAKLPNGVSAKYYYKNKTIYFAEDIAKQNLGSIAIHECIHYLQEKYGKNGEIIRLGLCDYTDANLPGTGLNEASVQLMAAKCEKNLYENVKYFEINISTNTPTYYPLECALVNQMAYVVGENILFESTINANDNFKEQFISLTSDKDFYTIQKNIDLLIEAQVNLERVYSNLQEAETNVNFIKKNVKEVNKLKEKIRTIFLETQKLILTSYFDNAINLAYTPKLIENYRNKLYNFKNIIGEVEGDNFYNNYYISKMIQIENKYDVEKQEEIKELVVVKKTFWVTLIRKIKTLFGFNPDYVGIKNKNEDTY